MSYRKFFLRTLKVATSKKKTSCKQHGTCTDQLAYPEPSLPCTESSNQQPVTYTTSESPPDHRNLQIADKTILCSESIPLTSSSDAVESSNTIGYMHSTPQCPLTPALHTFSFSSEPEYDSVNSNQAQSSEYIQRSVLIPSQKTSYSFHNPFSSLLPSSWFSKIDTFADVEENLKSVTFTSDLMQHENRAPRSFLSFQHILSAASSFVNNKGSWLLQSHPVESQLSDARDFGLNYSSSNAASSFVDNTGSWLSQSLPAESQLSDAGDFGLNYFSSSNAASSFVDNTGSWLSQSLPVESQLSDARDFGLNYFSSSKQNFTATSASINEQGSEFQNHNTSGEIFSSNDCFSQFSATPYHCCVADSLPLDANKSDIAVQAQFEIESEISNSTNVPIESPPTAITPSNQKHERDYCLGNRAVHNKSIETRCSTSSTGSVSSVPRTSGMKTRSKSFEESRKLRRLNGRARLWNTTFKGSKNNKFIVKRNDTSRSSRNALHNNGVASSSETKIPVPTSSRNAVHNNEGIASSSETKTPVPTIEHNTRQKECNTNKLQCKRNKRSSTGMQRIKRCPSPMLTRSSSRHTSRRLRCHKAPRRAIYLEAYDVPMHKPKSYFDPFLNMQIDSGRKRVQHAITVAAPSFVAGSSSSAGELKDKSELSTTVETLSHSSVTASVTEMQNQLHSAENLDVVLAKDDSDGMKHLAPLDAEAADCGTQNVLLNGFRLEGSDLYLKDISAENLTNINSSAGISTSNLNSVEHYLSLELTPDVENKKNCNKIIQDGREVLLSKDAYTNGSYDKPETCHTNCHCVESCVSHSATSLTRKRGWQRCSSLSEDSSSSLSPLNDSPIPIKRVKCHSNDYLENTSFAFSECEQNGKYSGEDGITASENSVPHSNCMSAESNSGESTVHRPVHTFDDVLKIKAKALAARKFRPPSRTELLQREMLRKLQHQSF